MNWKTGIGAAAAAGLLACSPALNWREVRPEGTDLLVLFPCKPDQHVRKLALAGHDVELTMSACNTAGATFALSHADAADPALVARSIGELRSASIGNVNGASRPDGKAEVPGMTPNEASGRLRIDGHFPDGRAAHIASLFFARGTQVFQASVVADSPDAAAIDNFFSSLKFGG